MQQQLVFFLTENWPGEGEIRKWWPVFYLLPALAKQNER
jgi:hypothetical protein